MKKIFTIAIALAILTLSIAGCSSNKPNKGEMVKTGIAVVSSISKSAEAGEKDGVAQSDSTVVAVTVDKDGKIENCFIDAAQTKANFSSDGKVVTPLDTEFKTKMELGADYTMKKASSIQKEWNEQATAFADYVIGKTIEEIKGIAVNEQGAPNVSDLTASVTLSIGDFQLAIEKAVANAKNLGAKVGDKLGLGVVTDIEKSSDVGEKDGLIQVYTTYAAVTFESNSKITSCMIDASQNNVNFNSSGKITTDLTAALKSKNELGDDYKMKDISSIKKEWYEQAVSFGKYAVGKTTNEIKGIAVSEGKATDTDLKASVTITIGDFIKAIEKAGSNAK